MAFYNANYEIINLKNGDVKEFPLSGKPIHEIFCTSTSGSAEITALGGGKATFNMEKGQSQHVMVSKIKVTNGEFIGFRKSGKDFSTGLIV